jgi:DNA-binding MarR family transcriptional regulator
MARRNEAGVLLVIEANANTTQSEIGRMLDIAGANMAPLVARLADRKLIERLPVDGRSHGLALTHAGRALAARARKTFKEHEEELLSRIPSSQHAAFMASLRALWHDE